MQWHAALGLTRIFIDLDQDIDSSTLHKKAEIYYEKLHSGARAQNIYENLLHIRRQVKIQLSLPVLRKAINRGRCCC